MSIHEDKLLRNHTLSLRCLLKPEQAGGHIISAAPAARWRQVPAALLYHSGISGAFSFAQSVGNAAAVTRNRQVSEHYALSISR